MNYQQWAVLPLASAVFSVWAAEPEVGQEQLEHIVVTAAPQ